MSGPAPTSTLAALGVRDYRIFWIAALVSNSGSWMQAAAIPYVVHGITGRAADVGVTGFLQYVPIMLLGLVGGSLADRFPRHRVLVVTQVLQALVALALWWVVASGRATVLSIAVLSFVAGLVAGLNVPVWQSFVSQLVPRDLLLNAVTLNSAQFNAARAVGPFLAGVAITTAGAASTFLINALSFGAVLIALALMGGPHPTVPHDRAGLRAGIGEALRYLRTQPAILTCCGVIIAVAGLGSPLFSYLPLYASEFGADGWRLGILLAASGAGSVLFAPLILRSAAPLGRKRLILIAMGGYGLTTVFVGAVDRYWVAIAALVAFGGAYLAIASTMNTTIQLVVREDLRGKVLAVYLACLTGALPLGLAVWGWAADLVGLRSVTVVAGVALVMVTALAAVTGRLDSLPAS